jgi:amino acid adenylation domain-containing protein
VSPDNLAYIVYTSGSTGRPKGTGIVHRAVNRLVLHTNYVDCRPEDTFLHLSTLAFDASTLEIWGPLLNGGRLAIAPPGVPALDDLAELVAREGVTLLLLPTGLFHQVADGAVERLEGVRQVLTGGDVASVALVNRVLRRLPGVAVTNGYGPTENTTYTCCLTTATPVEGATVPIGRPVSNTRVHVLDADLRPVPAGAWGELYAAGDGLARGYLDQPAETAAVFLPDHLAAEPGARMYRTGDVARLLPGGSLEFRGRIDDQVKIRGFRVEPGELEAALRRSSLVRDGVAVVREDRQGDRRLVAVVVPAAGGDGLSEALAAELSRSLPPYLLPSAIVVLDALPLTPNGKVDRRELSRTDAAATAAPASRRPEGPFATAVAAVWGRVLGTERPGLDDDFFESGGHSLTAVQLVAGLRAELGRRVALDDVFSGQTLGGLVERVERAAMVDDVEVTAGSPPALSLGQRRLWFVQQLAPGTTVYSTSFAQRLRGQLDAGALQTALRAVSERQDVLRWRIPDAGGEPYAACDSPGDVPLPVDDLSALPADERERALRTALDADARTRFDLAAGPLWRPRLLRLAVDDHVLVIAAHHVVIDGWSQAPFLRDLGRAYSAAAAGEVPNLGPLPATFADYVAWRSERARRRSAADLEWWVEHLAGAPTVLDLPRDRPRLAVQAYRGASAHADLDAAADAAVRGLARALSATPSTVLLAAFGQLLRRLTGRGESLVGAPFADRQHMAFQETVGFLLDVVPLRLRALDEGSFSEHVRACRDELVDALAHRDASLERLVETLPVERDLSRNPLIQVLFNVYNFPDPVLDLPGIAAEALPVGLSGSPFDLTVYVTELGGRFGLDLVYSPDLYRAERASRLLADYLALIGELVAAPDRPVRLATRPPAAPASLAAAPSRVRPPAVASTPVAPATDTERAIARVWKEMLRLPAVGVTDNFFDLGGHSLELTAARARIVDAVGRELTVVDLFRHPNVRALAAFVEGRAGDRGLERAAQRVASRRERQLRRPSRRNGGRDG